MAKKGGQPGNQNPANGALWKAALHRALAKRSKSRKDMKDALDDLAEKFLAQCDEGQVPAFKELGDRLDGKAAQLVLGPGENGEHLASVKVKYVSHD